MALVFSSLTRRSFGLKMNREIDRWSKSNNKHKHTVSEIFVAKNGTPQENVARVIEMMGGIEKFIGINDIVILKPSSKNKPN